MGPPGGAYLSDDTPHRHRRAGMNAGRKGGHMRVASHHAIRVLDVHDIAVGIVPAGIHHGAAGRRADRRAHRRHQVDAAMIGTEAPRDFPQFGGRHDHGAAESGAYRRHCAFRVLGPATIPVCAGISQRTVLGGNGFMGTYVRGVAFFRFSRCDRRVAESKQGENRQNEAFSHSVILTRQTLMGNQATAPVPPPEQKTP